MRTEAKLKVMEEHSSHDRSALMGFCASGGDALWVEDFIKVCSGAMNYATEAFPPLACLCFKIGRKATQKFLNTTTWAIPRKKTCLEAPCMLGGG